MATTYTPIANSISLRSSARPFADIPNVIQLSAIAPLYDAVTIVLNEVEKELSPENIKKTQLKA